MKNKININNFNFEFPNYVNKEKFFILKKICDKLNNNQKISNISTCSQRKR